MRWGGVGEWGHECSVNGRDGERLLPKLPPTFSWKHRQMELKRWKPNSYSSISQPSSKMQRSQEMHTAGGARWLIR